jgi:hypothetical protein
LLEAEVVVGFVTGALATADDEEQGLLPAQKAAIKMMVLCCDGVVVV